MDVVMDEVSRHPVKELDIYWYALGDVHESDSDNDDEFKCGSPSPSLE